MAATILLVGTNNPIFRSLSFLLEQYDYSVVRAESLEKGWKHITTTQVGLIISDYELKDGTGLGLLYGLRLKRPDIGTSFVLLANERQAQKIKSERFQPQMILDPKIDLESTIGQVIKWYNVSNGPYAINGREFSQISSTPVSDNPGAKEMPNKNEEADAAADLDCEEGNLALNESGDEIATQSISEGKPDFTADQYDQELNENGRISNGDIVLPASGQLNKFAYPFILSMIGRVRYSGVLNVGLDGKTILLYFSNGNGIWAVTKDIPKFNIRKMMVDLGLVDPGILVAYENYSNDLKVCKLLFKAGHLKKQGLKRIITEYIKQAMLMPFASDWSKGNFSFSGNSLSVGQGNGISIPLYDLILTGIRENINPNVLREFFIRAGLMDKNLVVDSSVRTLFTDTLFKEVVVKLASLSDGTFTTRNCIGAAGHMKEKLMTLIYGLNFMRLVKFL